jgi:aspartyl protease family protein
VLLLLSAGSAVATDVNVSGLFSDKAVVSVNGGPPRVLRAGQSSPEGVKLIGADSRKAVFEIDGKRQTLSLGQRISSTYAPSDNASVTLVANAQGHFLTTGSINGATTRFLVDTGASMVALSASEAKRLGISYLNGERGLTSTANGVVPVYRVVIDNVRVGDVVLNQVDCAVIEGDTLPVTLLGMSFLKRLEMKRDGNTLTLTKKY